MNIIFGFQIHFGYWFMIKNIITDKLLTPHCTQWISTEFSVWKLQDSFNYIIHLFKTVFSTWKLVFKKNLFYYFKLLLYIKLINFVNNLTF